MRALPTDDVPASASFLEALETVFPDETELDRLAYGNLPAAGYAVPMLVHAAIARGNELVDWIAPWGSADHNALFTSVITVLKRMVDTAPDFRGPYFIDVMAIDPAADACVQFEYAKLAVKDLCISVTNGYWQVARLGEGYSLSLPPALRRSALHLLNLKATYLSYEEPIREILDGPKDGSRVMELTLAIGLRELEPISKGVEEAWTQLLKRVGISEHAVVTFLAFIAQLLKVGVFWLDKDVVFKLLGEFTEDHGRTVVTRDEFDRIFALYSSDLGQALNDGVAIPFLSIHDWCVFWPFFNHVIHPALTFVALLSRKHPDAWNNTVGSQAANVARYLHQSLPSVPNVLVASVRKRNRIGDIDLGLYDVATRHLVLCEVKTVFDRYRTRYQRMNYVDQRVNFAKANQQLNDAALAITNGAWRLADIFGTPLQGVPAKISKIILTFWDVENANLGTPDAGIPVCNFVTFRYLFAKSGGNLDDIVDTIVQLGRVFCPARLVPDFLDDGTRRVDYVREVQTDALPPESMLATQIHSRFAQAEIADLKKFPEDWVKQVRRAGEREDDYVFLH